jgi:opacity protein-like surface antigen
MQFKKLFMISLLTLGLVPTTASAQNWFFSPFVGANFGGQANFGDFDDTEDEIERRLDFGASVGWNPGIVGFEVDFGYSPNFFQETRGTGNFEFGDSNVTTLMANILVSAPAGTGIRPYASGGLGLIRSRIGDAEDLFDDLTANDLGLNLGGGVNGQFTDNMGIRGDIRYFRALSDNEPDNNLDLGLGSFDFWRGTVGLTFRW